MEFIRQEVQCEEAIVMVATRIDCIKSESKVSKPTLANRPMIPSAAGLHSTQNVFLKAHGCKNCISKEIYVSDTVEGPIDILLGADVAGKIITGDKNSAREIKNLTENFKWHYVSGDLNPADLPSRRFSLKRLIKSGWLSSSAWLLGAPLTWSNSLDLIYDEEEILKKEDRLQLLML
ncbi:hypothetical protein ILUMI_22037 [Ignelater luminosus]|uniref:Uncharacterized protein n=1 Tax=Ignelater luminosus TaxID=2038154 RepID=A0A8K0CGK7_IGNLU|nr:hypothetical protein ILUMI_22037 [Ignelater luminosus]